MAFANGTLILVHPCFSYVQFTFQVLQSIKEGDFGWEDYFLPLVESVMGDVGGDFYLLANDFPLYLDAQAKVLVSLRF